MAHSNRQLDMEAVSHCWWVFRQNVHQGPVAGGSTGCILIRKVQCSSEVNYPGEPCTLDAMTSLSLVRVEPSQVMIF